jgi:hypothetical protein
MATDLRLFLSQDPARSWLLRALLYLFLVSAGPVNQAKLSALLELRGTSDATLASRAPSSVSEPLSVVSSFLERNASWMSIPSQTPQYQKSRQTIAYAVTLFKCVWDQVQARHIHHAGCSPGVEAFSTSSPSTLVVPLQDVRHYTS